MGRRDPSILHLDLDAFFASVEQLLDPALGGRPVVVGGLGPRGVVSAASYEARRFGVHSAMPMAHARRACPGAVFLAPRFEEYLAFSRRVMAILRSVTPLVEPLSVDEAFLDVAGARRLHGSPEQIGASLRRRIREETGLPASVGAATTKFLAKMASEDAKPDGLVVIEPGRELAYLHPLPVGRLWGVGPATLGRLERMGVRTVGDLARVPEPALAAVLGAAQARHLHALARNDDERGVSPGRRAKSVGAEETFARDLHERATLEREVLRLADRVASRLRRGDVVARTVTLKVRFADFRTITRAHTLPHATDTAAEITEVARALLAEIDPAPGVRLVGVTASHLVPAGAVQASLPLGADLDRAAEERRRHAAVERAVDEVRERFGTGAVGPATLLPAPEGEGEGEEEEEDGRTWRRPG